MREEVEWAAKAAENIGTVQEGPPPVEFWGALVACNEVHPSDARLAAARLADRMAAGISLGCNSPIRDTSDPGHELSVGKLESRLDIVHLLVTLGREVKWIQENHSSGQNIHAEPSEQGGREMREREPTKNPLEGETKITQEQIVQKVRGEIELGGLPITFDFLRDPAAERRERKVMTRADLEDLTNPARRMLIATRPFTAVQLNELALRV